MAQSVAQAVADRYDYGAVAVGEYRDDVETESGVESGYDCD